jgi:hypothetical protein
LNSSLPHGPEFDHYVRMFKSMWAMCVETSDEEEERLSYLAMKSAYCRLMGDPPTDPQTGLPTGMWEAMKWMAKVRVASG